MHIAKKEGHAMPSDPKYVIPQQRVLAAPVLYFIFWVVPKSILRVAHSLCTTPSPIYTYIIRQCFSPMAS